MAAGDVTDKLVDQVRSRLGEPSKQGLLDEEIIGYLNFAQRDLAIRLNDAAVPELTPVVTDHLVAARAAVPADLQRVRLSPSGPTKSRRRRPVPERDAFTDNIYAPPTMSPITSSSTRRTTRCAPRRGRRPGLRDAHEPNTRRTTVMTTDVDPRNTLARPHGGYGRALALRSRATGSMTACGAHSCGPRGQRLPQRAGRYRATTNPRRGG